VYIPTVKSASLFITIRMAPVAVPFALSEPHLGKKKFYPGADINLN
jgi:hypothetical protein